MNMINHQLIPGQTVNSQKAAPVRAKRGTGTKTRTRGPSLCLWDKDWSRISSCCSTHGPPSTQARQKPILAVACSRGRAAHCAAPLDSRHSRRPRRLSQINIISCGRGVQPPGSNHTEPNEEGAPYHWAARWLVGTRWVSPPRMPYARVTLALHSR